MEFKAYNPLTGKVEKVTKEEVKFLNALRDQFEEDVQLLMAEREIVKSILDKHLNGDEDVCKDQSIVVYSLQLQTIAIQ